MLDLSSDSAPSLGDLDQQDAGLATILKIFALVPFQLVRTRDKAMRRPFKVAQHHCLITPIKLEEVHQASALAKVAGRQLVTLAEDQAGDVTDRLPWLAMTWA